MVISQQRSLNIPDTTELKSVEDYQFEPIKGYPMLHWKGKRPFRSTQYYPAQLKEIHGEAVDGWRNKIFWGDNLQVMSHLLKEFRGKINLVYIDPPFDSKADYKRKIQLRGKTAASISNCFEDKQYTDLWLNDEYLQFMYERLVLLKELLSETGSIAVHCDVKRIHYLKPILDEIFGYDNFRSEIIVRTGVKNVQAQFEEVSSLSLGHNSILLYSKNISTKYSRLQILEDEFKPGKWDTFWRGTDRPTMRYELFGRTPNHGQWRWEKGRTNQARSNYETYLKEYSSRFSLDEYYLQELDKGNDIDFVRLSEDGTVQYYVPPRKYKLLSNVWLDIPYKGVETDYPTEKHESISRRLIEWLTQKNDLVFDCFMGSGTTQAVATKLGRRFIGADINLGAVQITTRRLLGIASDLEGQKQQGKLKIDKEEPIIHYTGFEICNVNHYELFRNPLEAKDILLEALEVQPLEQSHLFDGIKDDRMVKIMPVNRIATRADLTELISGFDYKAFEQRQKEAPTKPVEKILLVCMGHEPDLAAVLEKEAQPFKIDVEVVDILRDKSNLEFKRDSAAQITVQGNQLVIEKFYPMNLLQKLSLQQENVEDWRELVESIMIDWNYDGAILEPTEVDIPDKNDLVKGRYEIPKDAGTIRVKITDLLSESLEIEVQHG